MVVKKSEEKSVVLLLFLDRYCVCSGGQRKKRIFISYTTISPASFNNGSDYLCKDCHILWGDTVYLIGGGERERRFWYLEWQSLTKLKIHKKVFFLENWKKKKSTCFLISMSFLFGFFSNPKNALFLLWETFYRSNKKKSPMASQKLIYSSF